MCELMGIGVPSRPPRFYPYDMTMHLVAVCCFLFQKASHLGHLDRGSILVVLKGLLNTTSSYIQLHPGSVFVGRSHGTKPHPKL